MIPKPPKLPPAPLPHSKILEAIANALNKKGLHCKYYSSFDSLDHPKVTRGVPSETASARPFRSIFDSQIRLLNDKDGILQTPIIVHMPSPSHEIYIFHYNNMSSTKTTATEAVVVISLADPELVDKIIQECKGTDQ